MKLIHRNWQHQIICSDGTSTMLTIENPHIMRAYVCELLSQIEGESGDFLLSENEKEISMSSNIVAIPSPVSFQIEDRRIQTRLTSSLKEYVVSTDMYLETNQILSALIKYAETVAEGFQYPITYKEPGSEDLIKILGFSPEYEYDDSLEKILEYMNLIHSYCGIGCFVIIGMLMFFSESEIALLVKECKSLKHSLFFIESKFPCDDILRKVIDNRIIIDEDGCEILSEGQ